MDGQLQNDAESGMTPRRHANVFYPINAGEGE